jgi:hypothetical protein
MFDNLRQKSAEEAEFLNDEAAPAPDEKPPKRAKARRATDKRASGLGPPQRFLLALMLFLNVTVLGLFALIVFEKIALPLF